MLGDQFGHQGLNACDIAARPRQTSGDASDHQVSGHRRDDGNRGRHWLHAERLAATLDYENIDAPPDQLLRKVRNKLVPLAEGPLLGDEVSFVNPAEFPHTLIEGPLAERGTWQRRV